MSNNDTTNATGWWATTHGVTDKASFGQKHWDLYGKNESGRRNRLYSHRNGVKYYWEFGCGHTEITDIPVVTHTYDVSPSEIDSFTPSVTIMTPNFTYTPDTLLDRQDRTLNKVTVGTIPIPPDPAPTAPSSPYDGRLVRSAAGGIWYIQSGHKRHASEMDYVWPLSVITGQYVQEQTVYNVESEAYETNAAYVNYGLPIVAEISDAIPDGPDIALTGQNGITNPNTLDLPIIDGSFDEE